MGLRIATNTASESVERNLNEVSGKISTSLNRLSSGKRITRAADDAAGLAVATNLTAQIRGLRQASQNANSAVSMIQASEGGLHEASNMLIRMRELSIQAASDTVGAQERGFLNQEYQQLLQEIDRIADSTTFNGRKILKGEGDEMTFQVGTRDSKSNRITFDASQSNIRTGHLDVEGNIKDKGDATDAIDNIDKAIQKLSGQRAHLGSIQNRLGSTIANLESQILSQSEARSVIEDVDVAAEVSNLTSNNIVKNAGVSALLHANDLHATSLKLLS